MALQEHIFCKDIFKSHYFTTGENLI